MSINDGIVKKMEKDKYFFVIKKSYYKEMEKNKFSVLEEAKNVNIGNTMPATLSIGIGIAGGTYAQSYNYARVAIDLALARGGDQAVVKSNKEITYFGGKREQTSKNTRVKARVKAEALREFITAKDQVIIMGHKIADVDSFGAAVGIYRAALTMEKKAYIVLNDITMSVRPLYESFCESPLYPDDMFIKSDEVNDVINDSTVAVVVDTNKPEMTECPELLKMTKTIVVFDHHRQSSNMIENTVLSYIEPYASSSCEMVAEVLQYITDDVRITNVEANSMYAGIVIDTNNFMNRTGVRTFEAAAFLRRCGADITYVRKIFRDDMESYRAKAEIVSSAEVFCEEYAIASYENLGKKGQIVNVNDGYARNFILPKKLGLEANNKNLNDLKLKKANDEKIAQEQLEEAQELGKKIEAGKVTLAIKVGEGGRTVGSVSTKEIAAAVKEQMGYDVDKKKIQLKETIKTLGTHNVPVKLHTKVTAELKVVVTEA